MVIFNVPPFLKNEMLEKELAQHGQLVSPIKMIPLGCKSPHLKHFRSFRRQVFMILKQNNEELNLAFSFRIVEFDYAVHVTSDTLKCFGCGAEGHLVRSCPERGTDHQAAASAAQPPVRATGQPAAHKDTHSVTQSTHHDTQGGENRADSDHSDSNDAQFDNEDISE